jgi:hypothetical protein
MSKEQTETKTAGLTVHGPALFQGGSISVTGTPDEVASLAKKLGLEALGVGNGVSRQEKNGATNGAAKTEVTSTKTKSTKVEEKDEDEDEAEEKPKRGRGRPPGSKNKKKDEEEKPVAKKAKKAEKDEDEDEEDEEEEDDDEDEEEEDDDEDEDDEEDEDEEEEEEEAPKNAKKKGGKKAELDLAPLKEASKLREIVASMREQGFKSLEECIEQAEKHQKQVPLLKRITDIPARVTQAYEMLTSSDEE